MKNKLFTTIIVAFLCLNITACSTFYKGTYSANDMNSNNSLSMIRKTTSNKKLVKDIIYRLEENHKIENNLDEIIKSNKIEEKSLTNIVSVLGKPDILRIENEAKILTYKSSECTINIFTYKKGNKYITKYAESNTIKEGSEIGFNNCLALVFLTKFN